jgi:predicted dehydrogenase
MLIRGRQATPLEIPPPVNTLEQALRAFLHVYLHDEAPPVTVLDGYHAVEIAEACYHSASTGDAVNILAEDEDDEALDDLDDDMWAG